MQAERERNKNRLVTPQTPFWSSADQTGWRRQGALTLAAAAVGGVTIEARDAAVAVASGRQVLTLLTHTLVHTLAVAVTLAR